MSHAKPHIEIDERLVNETIRNLEAAREVARHNDEGYATLRFPAVVIDGLLGMVRGPEAPDFWYRRRQFIVFYAMFVATRKNGLTRPVSDG